MADTDVASTNTTTLTETIPGDDVTIPELSEDTPYVEYDNFVEYYSCYYCLARNIEYKDLTVTAKDSTKDGKWPQWLINLLSTIKTNIIIIAVVAIVGIGIYIYVKFFTPVGQAGSAMKKIGGISI